MACVRGEVAWRAGLLAVALAIAAACGPAPSTVPLATLTISCPETELDPPPHLTCVAAVEAAESALPFLHPLVVSIAFDYGGWCPPWARCAFVATTDRGYVIFSFASGDPLLVDVAADPATGTISVIASGPLPSGG